jgi:spore coat protein JC
MEMGYLQVALADGGLIMWIYEKKLQYPVKIKNPNAKYAQIIISQLGGPDGELAASTRYLSQRYSMPDNKVVGILTDVGTEELAHVEMISAILHQLTRNLTPEEIARSGFDKYFVDHTVGVYPVAAAGVPFDAKYIGVKGDVIADLTEDLAAEQKARVTYDNLLRLIDDPDVRDPLKFLREREIVHFQRFGDALRLTQDKLDEKNFYAFNPAFDKRIQPR